jgi:hypothetical protein
VRGLVLWIAAMHDNFEARNELETQLLAVQEGEITTHDNNHYLKHTQVIMPVKDSNPNAAYTTTDTAKP